MMTSVLENSPSFMNRKEQWVNWWMLVDKMVKTSLSEDKTKEKHEKYNRPENCENLINTRVNPEIWSNIRANTRSTQVKSSEDYDP